MSHSSVFSAPAPAARPTAAPGSHVAGSGKPGGAPAPGKPTSPASAFRRAADAVASLRPARVVLLPASAWCADYPGAQKDPVEVGLRVYSEGEAVQARAAAAQRAWKLHPQETDEEERVAAGNGALMAWLVAKCATKSGDRRVPFFGDPRLGGAEDVVPMALTSGGLEWLFGELENLVFAESPTAPEADDEDVAWLLDALRDGALDKLGAVEARRARRLLAGAMSWMQDG